MTDATATTTAPAQPRVIPEIRPIPVRDWAPWAVLALALTFFLLYLVGMDQGATSIAGGHLVHEFVHDARHLLGFPCH
jgi:hypothetical protein